VLQNPDNALWLYIVLLVVGFMFGKRWQGVRDALAAAGQAGQAKVTTGG